MEENSIKKKKDFWDKLTAIGTFTVPITLAIFGYLINLSIKQSDTKVRMLEISVNILKTDPTKKGNIPDLRDWAVSVFETYAEVPLSKEVRESLKKNPLPSGASEAEIAALTRAINKAGIEDIDRELAKLRKKK